MKKLLRTIVTAVSLAAMAGAATAAEKMTYLFPAPDFLPAFAPFKIAMAKGYYTDAGLDVTFQVGKGGADVALKEDGDGTILSYTAKADVGGKMAQLGSRLIQSTSKKLAAQFFADFNKKVSGN